MMRACTATRCALLLLHNAARRLFSSALAAKQEIERVRQPGLEAFTKEFFQAGVPVIITDAIKDWPAASWTPDVLREQFGEVVVPVEISQWHEKAGRWGDYRDLYAEARDQWDCGKKEVFTPYQEMPLSFFIDNFVLNTWELPEVNTRWRAYLAQHQLFERLPNLAASVIEPVYIRAGKGLHQKNVWLGPSQTTTPLHQDPYHNLFAQIFGRKYVRLYHPRDTAAMHPFQHSPLLRNTSKIDVESPDVAKAWPDFVGTPFWECELRPGELLFVPRKWWHYVRAIDTSLSISFWWTCWSWSLADQCIQCGLTEAVTLVVALRKSDCVVHLSGKGKRYVDGNTEHSTSAVHWRGSGSKAYQHY